MGNPHGTPPGQQKKLDRSKLKSTDAHWNQRAEETFDAVTPIRGRRARLRAWFAEIAKDTRALIESGDKAAQLAGLQALQDNQEAGFDMVLDTDVD